MRHVTISLALTAAALLAAPALAAEPLDMFGKVCLGGEGRFGRGEVSPAALADLPRVVRKSYRVSADAKLFRLNSAAPAFLVVGDDPATKARECTLIAQGVPLFRAIELMTGTALPMTRRTLYTQSGNYRETRDGATLVGDVIPPDYLVATVRQSAAPAPPPNAR